MTGRSLWTSQPLMAAQGVILAWVAMRIVYAQGDALPDLPPASVRWVSLAQIEAAAMPALPFAGMPERHSKSMISRQDVAPPKAKPAFPHLGPTDRSVMASTDPLPPVAFSAPSLRLPLPPPPAASAHLAPIPKAPQASLSSWTLRGSGWMLTRASGGQTALAAPGQLTGGQAGMRLYLSPGGASWTKRLAITAGISAPLASASGREASLGLAWQPLGNTPITLIAERRFALAAQTPSRFMLLAAGGVPDQRLGGRWTLRGYAQAGFAGIKRRDGFADGSLDVTRPVAITGSLKLEAGLGGWAAIQPGLHRVDVGPRLDVILSDLPRPMRLSLQWRERVAGKARPGSGLALVVGTDF